MSQDCVCVSGSPTIVAGLGFGRVDRRNPAALVGPVRAEISVEEAIEILQNIKRFAEMLLERSEK